MTKRKERERGEGMEGKSDPPNKKPGYGAGVKCKLTLKLPVYV